jgi:hypothetical protein
MTTRLYRSIREPIRDGLSWEERWRGPDQGLIWCWERGRQMRTRQPERAARAEQGELMVSEVVAAYRTEPVPVWRGGVSKRLKDVPIKPDGSLNYLAEWQGLRGEDLDIDVAEERVIVCTKTGQAVAFSAMSTVE